MCIFSKPSYSAPKVDPAPTPATTQDIAQPEASGNKKRKPVLDFAATRTSVLTDEATGNGKRTTLG